MNKYRFTGEIWGINLYFYQAICLSLPPWKLFGVFLNVWESSSTNKLPLGGLGYLFVYTAIPEILGAVNIFVTVIEKKIEKNSATTV